MARTEEQLVNNVLLSIGVLDAYESASAADYSYVVGRYRDIHAELADDNYALAYWRVDAIPETIFEPLTQLVAMSVMPAFGLRAMAEQLEGSRRIVLARIRRHAQTRSANVPYESADF